MSILASPYPQSQEPDDANRYRDGSPPFGNTYKPQSIKRSVVQGTVRELLQDHVEAAKLFISEPAEVWHPLRFIEFIERVNPSLLDMPATLIWEQNRKPGDDFGRIEVLNDKGKVGQTFRITL